jgi:DNA-binding NtrC family response regulator
MDDARGLEMETHSNAATLDDQITHEIRMSAPKTTRWRIDVQDDEGGRSIPLAEGATLRVGSSQRCEVVMADPTVSHMHLEICVQAMGVLVRDLSSKNGTFIGGARVREAWGGAGATINIGSSTLTVAAGIETPDEPDDEALPGVIGASHEMRCVAGKVRRLASRRAPVLILGESGVGKELIARALHDEGCRSSRPFVALNVTAMPRDLVESELFGHERGAFTGAVTKRPGAFAEADGGTLFLDEIGDLPLEVQPKLLRALDGYEVRRVGATGGGSRSQARVVAATNIELEKRVADGMFRRDLFHRLEVFVIRVPPLRERRGDICAIAKHLVRRVEDGPRKLTSAALSTLASYHWPGNVRELANVLTRAADLARDEEAIDAMHLQLAMAREGPRSVNLTPSLAKAILRDHGGNLSAAARAAGIPRTTFRKLVTRP